ncbi:MAG: TonB-dependent receptor [Pseudomonadota bacterium]
MFRVLQNHHHPNACPHRQQTTRWSLGVLFAVLAGMIGIASPVSAQVGLGGLEVRVVQSETRRPLANASIRLIAREGDTFEAMTDDEGVATFDSLAPGLYTLTATATGRQAIEEPSVRIVSNRILSLDVVLQPALELPAELANIVVIGRAIEADRSGVVGNRYRSREELRTAPGTGSDVLRALDGLPGLVSTGEFANFSVRGRGPRDNLILIDDLPFDQVVHFDQSLGELEDIEGGGRYSIFAPDTIAGAEFSPGGWSAAYGGRSGSLLRLNVAEGGPTARSTLRVDIAGAEVLHEGPIGLDSDTSMLLSARQFNFERVFDLVGEDDVGRPELADVLLKTSTRLGMNDTLELLAIHATEDFTRDVENARESENFEDLSLVDASQDATLLGLSWRRLIGNTAEWTNRFYYRASDKETREGEAFPDLVPDGSPLSDIPVREDIIRLTEKETEFGWRSDFSVLNRFGQFNAGSRVSNVSVDFETELNEPWARFVFRSDDPRPPGQNFIVLQPEDVNSRLDESELNWAVFTEQTFEQQRWDLRVGLRYDHDGFSDEGYFSPRLTFNYRLSPATRFSASAGLFYQSPRFLDRASDPANFRLANEQITHFSAGISHRFNDRWDLLIEAYAQQLDDLVTEDVRTSGTLSNNGEGDNLGVDVVLTRKFADGLSGNIVYSYNDLRIDDNDGLGEYDGDFSRPHFFSIGGLWEINDRWSISARWKYSSGRPRDDFIVFDNVLGDDGPLRFSQERTTRNTLRADDYQALNLRVDYRRSIFDTFELVTFLDVINVIGGDGASPPEFNPTTGMDVDEDGEPLPIIGLILEKNW